MTVDLLKDFTKGNIIKWIKELVTFIQKPRAFVHIYSLKSTKELFSQYLFYFICYTFSYLLVSTSSEFNTLFKSSAFDLIEVVPLIFILSISTKVATGKSYFKKIALFLITLHIIVAPVLIILFVIYVSNESYIYLILYSILDCSLVLFSVYGFSFIIEKSVRIALWIWIVFIFLSASCYVGLLLVGENLNQADLYYFGDNDDFYADYEKMTTNVHNHLEVPIRITYEKDHKIHMVQYAIQAIGYDKFIISDSTKIINYYNDVKANKTIVQNKLKDTKYSYNKICGESYIKYYSLIDSTFQHQDFTFKSSISKKIILITIDTLNQNFIRKIELNSDLIITRDAAIRGNNRIIKLHTFNLNVRQYYGDGLLFLFGRMLDQAMYGNEKTSSLEPFLKAETD